MSLVTKNATALAIRMIIVTLIGLYTSRVKLQALGVDDYAIYALVGALIALGAFLNNTLTGATTRFITYAVGNSDKRQETDCISTSVALHLIVALGTILLAIPSGLCYIHYHLDIPATSLHATSGLFLLSLISLGANIVQAPYIALMFAHERMKPYAVVEITAAIGRLLIAWAILATPDTTRLLWLGALDATLSLAILATYNHYCRRHWSTAHARPHLCRHLSRDITRFALLDLYGNTCVTVAQQSLPLIVNRFFSLAVNTALAIATTVTNALTQLAMSISRAYDPRITKAYAAGDYLATRRLVRRSALHTTAAMILLATPLWMLTPTLLHIWLGQVPPHAVTLTRAALLVVPLTAPNLPLSTAIHATGNIRRISLITGTLTLLTPLLTLLLFTLTTIDTSHSSLVICHSSLLTTPSALYLALALTTLLTTLSNYLILRHQLPQSHQLLPRHTQS